MVSFSLNVLGPETQMMKYILNEILVLSNHAKLQPLMLACKNTAVYKDNEILLD